MPITTARITNLRNVTTDKGCLSIYMQTDPKVHAESIKQNMTRLKNVIQSLQREPSYDKEKFSKMIASLDDLLDDLPFWQQQDMSLAIFADIDGNCTPIRLPYPINDFTSIGDTYAISPLVAMKSIDRGFYLLDINLKTRPRLFRTVGRTLVEVEAEEMPQSFEKIASQYEYDNDVKFKGAPRGPGSGDGDAVSYHGADLHRELDDKRRAFLHDIAKAVDTFLEGRERPLVLAGTTERVGNVRKYLTYPTVLDEYVNGDVGEEAGSTLYRKALPFVTTYRRALIDQSVRELFNGGPENIVTGEEAVLQAAEAKRVARLFLPLYQLSDEDSSVREVTLEIPSEDLATLEQLVRSVLIQNGDVQAVEIEAYENLNGPIALTRF